MPMEWFIGEWSTSPPGDDEVGWYWAYENLPPETADVVLGYAEDGKLLFGVAGYVVVSDESHEFTEFTHWMKAVFPYPPGDHDIEEIQEILESQGQRLKKMVYFDEGSQK